MAGPGEERGRYGASQGSADPRGPLGGPLVVWPAVAIIAVILVVLGATVFGGGSSGTADDSTTTTTPSGATAALGTLDAVATCAITSSSSGRVTVYATGNGQISARPIDTASVSTSTSSSTTSSTSTSSTTSTTMSKSSSTEPSSSSSSTTTDEAPTGSPSSTLQPTSNVPPALPLSAGNGFQSVILPQTLRSAIETTPIEVIWTIGNEPRSILLQPPVCR